MYSKFSTFENILGAIHEGEDVYLHDGRIVRRSVVPGSPSGFQMETGSMDKHDHVVEQYESVPAEAVKLDINIKDPNDIEWLQNIIQDNIRIPMETQESLINKRFAGRIPAKIAEFMDVNPWILNEEEMEGDLRNMVQITTDIFDLEIEKMEKDTRIDLLSQYKKFEWVASNETQEFRQLIDQLDRCKRRDVLAVIMHSVDMDSFSIEQRNKITTLLTQRKHVIECLETTRYENWLMTSCRLSQLNSRINWIKIHMEDFDQNNRDKLNNAVMHMRKKLSIQWTARKHSHSIAA